MIKIHTFAFLIFICFNFALIQESESLLACGGNCPDKSCKSCICGQAQQIISLDEFCSRSKIWDVNCCKCIAARASGGNAHFMKYEPGSVELKGWYDIGILPVSNQGCFPETVTDSQLCDNAINFKCA
jgi:hypothetical protein